jgi:hypothetical protein
MATIIGLLGVLRQGSPEAGLSLTPDPLLLLDPKSQIIGHNVPSTRDGHRAGVPKLLPSNPIQNG